MHESLRLREFEAKSGKLKSLIHIFTVEAKVNQRIKINYQFTSLKDQSNTIPWVETDGDGEDALNTLPACSVRLPAEKNEVECI